MPFGRNHYVNALEKRVADLEAFLAQRGLLEQVAAFTPYDLPGSSSAAADDASFNRPPSAAGPANATRTAASSPSEEGGQASDSENGDAMVKILRDLSLESNGGYIGASSHFTIGRLVTSIIESKHKNAYWEDGLSGHTTLAATPDGSANILLSDVPQDVATRLFYGYMKHVATRYPVLQSTWIYDLHCRRDRIQEPYERSTLHLVYAIAGRFLETTGETNLNFFPDRHQAQVLQYLDEMLHYHDTRSVVTLLLLAVYSLRAEGGPGAWTYIGLAMRIAIDLGLHRQTSAMNRLGFDVELRKRLFWSCYTMDRQISIPLGRPFSVADHDIDVALPLDVDESCQDIHALERAAQMDPNVPRTESTTLTAFLHILRLRRIESSIQHTIYRVDQTVNVTDAEVDHYLEQLEKWRLLIPLDAKRQVDRETVAFDGYDYYMVFYYKCHRLLLFPLVSRPRPNPRYLKACAKVCGGVAQTYKRLHQILSVGYSLMALQTVFMAGLTLVYCAWLSPEEVFSSAISNDINACCIVLFVITERWPAARKYRDAFEVVKQIVIDPLSDSQNHKPRRAIDIWPAVELPLDDGRQQYDDIVTHMSGRQTHSIAPSREPVAIGMEQVRYQMGEVNPQDELQMSGQHVGETMSISDPAHASVLPNIPPVAAETATVSSAERPSNSLATWSNDVFNDAGYSAGIEPLDMEGFTLDMGWMADSFGPMMR